MQLIATCPDELKEVLAQEIEALGGKQIELGYRAVLFEASETDFYRIHLKISTASRILRTIATGPASTEDELYRSALKVKWEKYFSSKDSFKIETYTSSQSHKDIHPNVVCKKVREALQSHMQRQTGQRPRVDLENAHIVVVAFIRMGKLTISLDTTGKSLHKRGYKVDRHPAPLKETLAASILKLAGYSGEETLVDPMCGSGSLGIEGAYMALKKAPQIHRKKGQFLFENHADFNKELWRQVQDQVRLERLEEPPFPIICSDINSSFVALARENALRARVEKHMTFLTSSFQDLDVSQHKPGLVIINLPYGERLGNKDEDMANLYKEVGDTLKKKYAGWRAAILVAKESPHKFIGLKPNRRIPVFNGSIECRLLMFELFAGSRKTSATPTQSSISDNQSSDSQPDEESQS